MWKVIGENKKTGEMITIDTFDARWKAEKECEEWGWSYSDSKGDYWMGIVNKME